MPRVLSYQLENIASMGVKMMYRTTLCSYTCVGIFWGGLEGGVESGFDSTYLKISVVLRSAPLRLYAYMNMSNEFYLWFAMYTDIRTCVTMHEHSYKRADLQLDVDLCGWGT